MEPSLEGVGLLCCNEVSFRCCVLGMRCQVAGVVASDRTPNTQHLPGEDDMRKMWIAGMLALGVTAGALGTLPAQASTSGRRNTALGLGAAAVYELLRGDTTTGLVLGAGAAYGYKRYRDEKRYEDRYYRYDRDYDRRYGYGYDSGYGYRPVRHDEYRRSDRDDRYYRSGERCRDRR
jgi:hypothetical protein